MQGLFNDIIKAFSSLWSFKKRGNSIEIVTPVSTTNDVFVSVFLTMRGDEYIVTDGGWIDAGVYDIDEVNNSQLESNVKSIPKENENQLMTESLIDESMIHPKFIINREIIQ